MTGARGWPPSVGGLCESCRCGVHAHDRYTARSQEVIDGRAALNGIAECPRTDCECDWRGDDALRVEHLGRIQPAPTPTDEPSAHDLVIAELEKRKAFGIAKYGVTLQAGNGRDHLRDALDEVLDLAVYLMCAIEQTKENR